MQISLVRDGQNNWTVCLDNSIYQFGPDHEKYDVLVQAIKDKDYETFLDNHSLGKAIQKWSRDNFVIDGSYITYKGVQIGETIAKRILEFMEEGLDYEPMLKFVENLYMNTSFRVVQELYRFLEHENLPITEDGCFLGYKGVTEDFKDFRTKTFDNSVGKVVEMPRNQVNDDCNQTCSHGLHVGALEYVKTHFSGGKIIICKVNPLDVVSVPTDYDGQKLRCCKYEVVGLFNEPLPSTLDKSYSSCTNKSCSCSNLEDEEYDDDYEDEDGWW